MAPRALLVVGALAIGYGRHAPARPEGDGDYLSLVQVPGPRPRPRPYALRPPRPRLHKLSVEPPTATPPGGISKKDRLEALQQRVEDDAMKVTELHRRKEQLINETEALREENEELESEVLNLESQLTSAGMSDVNDQLEAAKQEGAASMKQARYLNNQLAGARAQQEAAAKEHQAFTEKMVELSSAEASLKLSVHDLSLKQQAWKELVTEEHGKSNAKTENLRVQLAELESNATRFAEKKNVLTSNNELIHAATQQAEAETESMREKLQQINRQNKVLVNGPAMELNLGRIVNENNVMKSAVAQVIQTMMPLQ